MGRFASGGGGGRTVTGGGVGSIGRVSRKTGKPRYAGGSSTPGSYKELRAGGRPQRRGGAAFKETFGGAVKSAGRAQKAGASREMIKGIERKGYALASRRSRNVEGLTRKRRYAKPS